MATAISVRFGLCLDDVGIGTCIAVKGSNPVVVERIGSQAGHILTSDITDIQIVIYRNVSTKGIARGDIQPVTGRTAYVLPVRSKAAGSFVRIV